MTRPSAPPVSLKMADRKEVYTVQTALATWAYFNWFTLQRSCGEVLEQFRQIVTASFADLQQEFAARMAAWAAMSGSPVGGGGWMPVVYTFAELSALVREHAGPELEPALAAQIMQEPGIDLRTFSCRLTEELWKASGLTGPAAVVGFAQVYSPPVHIAPESAFAQAAAGAARSVASETGLALEVRHYFPYISDMSFLGCPESAAGLQVLQENSPGWGWLYRVDHAGHARLNLPVINIGTWGTGAHTRQERVERAYSFGVVPELIWRTLAAPHK